MVFQRFQPRAKSLARGLQDAFKTPPRGLQDAPRRLQDAPRRSKTAPRRLQDAPRRLQDAPRRLQDAPRCLQDAPRRLQDAPKRPKMPLRCSQDAQGSPKRLILEKLRKTNGFSTFSVSLQLVFKRFSEAPRGLQEGPKRLQDDSKTLQATKLASNQLQQHQKQHR